MRRKELSLFFSLTKEEQGQLIEEARRDFIQRHGKVTFWVFWIAAQLAGIAVLSFFVGFPSQFRNRNSTKGETNLTNGSS